MSAAEAAATCELAKLAALFASAAMAQPYGEELSIRDHMLQCAQLAVARGLGDGLVAAALLHDIGWALERDAKKWAPVFRLKSRDNKESCGDAARDHPQLAADLLAPLFGAETADPVRHHVDAKRYLVATDPDYTACLSAESRRTLTRQGGPMTPAECALFAAGTGFAAALQLRRLDDAGKAAEPPETGFATYAPLLHRLLVSRLATG